MSEALYELEDVTARYGEREVVRIDRLTVGGTAT